MCCTNARNSLLKGVYWGHNFKELSKGISDGKLTAADCRFFVGYSGWAPGQLAGEVKEDSWYIRDANADIVFAEDQANQWRHILKNMGPEFKMIANFPDDPRMN